MISYFDTSAFVKLFVRESGSTSVRLLWARTRHAVASTLLYPETRAAVSSAVRDGRVADEDDVVPLVERLVGQIALVAPTRDLVWRAGELASKHGLRGYDAVHLASALAVAMPGTSIVTADRRLASAAAAEGLLVADGPLRTR